MSARDWQVWGASDLQSDGQSVGDAGQVCGGPCQQNWQWPVNKLAVCTSVWLLVAESGRPLVLASTSTGEVVKDYQQVDHPLLERWSTFAGIRTIEYSFWIADSGNTAWAQRTVCKSGSHSFQ